MQWQGPRPFTAVRRGPVEGQTARQVPTCGCLERQLGDAVLVWTASNTDCKQLVPVSGVGDTEYCLPELCVEEDGAGITDGAPSYATSMAHKVQPTTLAGQSLGLRPRLLSVCCPGA
uniref:Uncharacterized protein n=1 Tax=Eutreptiella gymnastica TaxID=73025 RepID=A0A7S4GNN5_9EUGL|mmetsp:Transcript_82132/g.137255  ORF Transcript_82132/g.137255 Transcript_82132/m.137255 type:complete len:117 (-) Transcript_82132:349-699(-)